MGFFGGGASVYAPENKFVLTNQDVTNSSTLTDSTDLQVDLLGNATYDFETMELVGGSSVSASGTKTDLSYTGTGTFYGIRMRAHAANNEPINATPSWPGTGNPVDGTISFPGGGSGQSTIGNRFGRIITTASGVLKIKFAQHTATSGHYARLFAGSYLKVQRVA